ncbi:MAG: acyl-CoA dehydrogenase, partial [Actinobacteria bacterium]|nr:acyl-CoA dehydrogenase [Actinomycetota bacterium]
MHLRDSDSDAVFRSEVRDWLRSAVASMPTPPLPDDWPGRRAYDGQWQRMLFDAGYAGINWPAEHGGRGATPTEHLIFLEESAAAKAPDVGVGFVGQMHAGPTVIAEGTDAQKSHHLRGILTGDHVWCQGFSEPGSGSDLASLRTRAFRDGDDYIVSGQKIWTSHAMAADYCEMLVRTDPNELKHKGISWLIMPMNLPGIDVRPLVTVHGSTEFAELFLDEVRVPVANLVGAENDGWRVANVTLSFERGTGFVGELLDTTNVFQELIGLTKSTSRNGKTIWEDDSIRREIGIIGADLDALWAFTKRNVSQGARGGMAMGSGSGFKVAFATSQHRLGDLALRVLDRASLSMDDLNGEPTGELVHSKLHAFAISLGGGTTQIQQNIIA